MKGVSIKALSNVAVQVTKKILWIFYYVSWLYRYVRLILGFNVLKDIKMLSIEFSSVCNLHCKYCFLGGANRPKYLDIDIYEKLIKEICENSKYDIKVMEWPISGEFFMYPHYKKVFEITRRYMDGYHGFWPHIILNDNVVLLDEEKIELILKSGIIKQVICSIDGHDAETFEEMRPPARFETVYKNIRLLTQRNKALGSPAFIQINNGRDERSEGKDLSKEMKEIFNLADEVLFWNPKYWNESFNKQEKQFHPAKGFCTFVFNNVTLSTSGFVIKCCMDLNGSTAYGDASKESLANIWHSTERKRFLTMMCRNRRHILDGCKACSITNVNNDNRNTNMVRTLKRLARNF